MKTEILTKKEDITESLKASNINKINMAVRETKSMIENSLNLFNKDADPDILCNICAGKSCKKGTEDFLLNVESISLYRNVYKIPIGLKKGLKK